MPLRCSGPRLGRTGVGRIRPGLATWPVPYRDDHSDRSKIDLEAVIADPTQTQQSRSKPSLRLV